MAILWGPNTYNETDTTTLSGGHVVKAIDIDFTGFPAGVNALTFVFISGQMQFRPGNFADLSVVLGGTGPNYFDGLLIWDGFSGNDWATWTDIVPTILASAGLPSLFTSPGNLQTLRFIANAGADAPTPAGIRNFTIEITGTPSGPSISSANVHDNRTVDVIFSAAVDPVTASVPSNYSITSGVVVTRAIRISDFWYRLTTTRQTNDVMYTITCSGINPLS